MEKVKFLEVLSGKQHRSDQLIIGVDNIEAALCFYKALKVYPQPSDLITIYGQSFRLLN